MPTIDEMPDAAVSPPVEDRRTIRSRDGIEFLIVIAFAFLPTLLTSSLVALGFAGTRSTTVFLDMSTHLIHGIETLTPLLFIIILRRRVRQTGLLRIRQEDAPWGAVALFGGYAMAFMTRWGLYEFATPLTNLDSKTFRYIAPVSGWQQYACIAITSTIVGFREELIYRGYLLTQWERLKGSTLEGVVVSTSLFAAAHIYQGPTGVVSAGGYGIVYALVFTKVRRLWPVVAAHAVTDFYLLSRA